MEKTKSIICVSIKKAFVSVKIIQVNTMRGGEVKKMTRPDGERQSWCHIDEDGKAEGTRDIEGEETVWDAMRGRE